MNPRFSVTLAQRPWLLNLAGLLVLVGGLGFAGSAWWTQEQRERQASAGLTNAIGYSHFSEPLAPEDSRRYSREVEMYYGKTGVRLEKWTRATESLTQGKPLAIAGALASILVASGLFLIAAAKANALRPPRS